jgi:hypothetical protein
MMGRAVSKPYRRHTNVVLLAACIKVLLHLADLSLCTSKAWCQQHDGRTHDFISALFYKQDAQMRTFSPMGFRFTVTRSQSRTRQRYKRSRCTWNFCGKTVFVCIMMKPTTIIPEYGSQVRNTLAEENTIRLHDMIISFLMVKESLMMEIACN